MSRPKSFGFGLAVLLTALNLVPAAFAAPTAWSVDPARSKLSFQGKMNGEAFNGVFRRWTAQIVFDPKALAASSVQVTVDAASAGTGDADRDQALPSDDWLAADKFAKASFTARSFRDLGGGKYQAAGELTLRGVSRPVVLPFTLSISGDTARMNGQVVLDRTAFGVGQGQWKTGDVVDTKVTVIVVLIARQAR
ncbi:MAG: YceI family protein [Caulobacteraceae bacterium]|nr:YceI family protein [Caulobacteraceae bacterium]